MSASQFTGILLCIGQEERETVPISGQRELRLAAHALGAVLRVDHLAETHR
jgi:hypothetical protein